jgi:hypothetical protein
LPSARRHGRAGELSELDWAVSPFSGLSSPSSTVIALMSPPAALLTSCIIATQLGAGDASAAFINHHLGQHGLLKHGD